MIIRRTHLLTGVVVIALMTSGYALTATSYSSVIYGFCGLGVLLSLLQVYGKTGGVQRDKVLVGLTALGLMCLLGLLASFLNPSVENSRALLKFILAAALGAAIFIANDFNRVSRVFADLMFFICAVSLVGYVALNFTRLPYELPVVENVNGALYKSAYLFFAFDGFLQYRNMGVFWEPGIFASMIFAALLSDLLVSRNRSALRLAVFLFALVSTFSGAAALLLAAYVAVAAFSSSGRRDSYASFAKAVAALLAIAALYPYVAFNEDIGAGKIAFLVDKIFDLGENQLTRIVSPMLSLEVFADKPLFGWGFVDAVERYRGLNQDVALTSTSAYMLAALGLGGLAYTLVPLIGIFCLSGLNRVVKLLLASSFLFIINKEPHTYFTLTHAVSFYLLFAIAACNGRGGRRRSGIGVQQ